jgi:hypothetical protein
MMLELHVRVPEKCPECLMTHPKLYFFKESTKEWLCSNCGEWNRCLPPITPTPSAPKPLESFEGLAFGTRIVSIRYGTEHPFAGTHQGHPYGFDEEKGCLVLLAECEKYTLVEEAADE